MARPAGASLELEGEGSFLVEALLDGPQRTPTPRRTGKTHKTVAETLAFLDEPPSAAEGSGR